MPISPFRQSWHVCMAASLLWVMAATANAQIMPPLPQPDLAIKDPPPPSPKPPAPQPVQMQDSAPHPCSLKPGMPGCERCPKDPASCPGWEPPYAPRPPNPAPPNQCWIEPWYCQEPQPSPAQR